MKQKKKHLLKIIINDKEYFIHPIYDLYAATTDEYVIDIIKQISRKGNIAAIWYTLLENIRMVTKIIKFIVLYVNASTLL